VKHIQDCVSETTVESSSEQQEVPTATDQALNKTLCGTLSESDAQQTDLIFKGQRECCNKQYIFWVL
jgi:hypothetical protein